MRASEGDSRHIRHIGSLICVMPVRGWRARITRDFAGR